MQNSYPLGKSGINMLYAIKYLGITITFKGFMLHNISSKYESIIVAMKYIDSRTKYSLAPWEVSKTAMTASIYYSPQIFLVIFATLDCDINLR